MIVEFPYLPFATTGPFFIQYFRCSDGNCDGQGWWRPQAEFRGGGSAREACRRVSTSNIYNRNEIIFTIENCNFL